MLVGYLVNQYPLVSHSFIRREIRALEQLGGQVKRFSIRPTREKLVDPDDVAELKKTRAVLSTGILRILLAAAWVALCRPVGFLRAARSAVRMGRRSERGIRHHLFYLAEACQLLGWLERQKIEHVHAHFGTNSATVAMLCRNLGGPAYSFTVHGPEEFDGPRALSLAEKISDSAFAIAVSNFGRSQLCRWSASRDWDKIHVVHCGVDEAFSNRHVTPVPSEKRLVSVGRLCEAKAQILLIDAIAILASEGVKVELVLIGDGPMRPQIQQAIVHHQLQEQIRLLGWRSAAEVRAEIVASRALVLPSFAEGLPVVLMEAMALGRPVVSTYVAGIPELVEPGINGWLVPAGSVHDLAAALREVLTAPTDLLAQMGQSGRQWVMRHHDARTEAAKLMALSRQAVEKSRTSC